MESRKLGWQGSNLRMRESKSLALPLGYTPSQGGRVTRNQIPPHIAHENRTGRLPRKEEG